MSRAEWAPWIVAAFATFATFAAPAVFAVATGTPAVVRSLPDRPAAPAPEPFIRAAVPLPPPRPESVRLADDSGMELGAGACPTPVQGAAGLICLDIAADGDGLGWALTPAEAQRLGLALLRAARAAQPKEPQP